MFGMQNINDGNRGRLRGRPGGEFKEKDARGLPVHRVAIFYSQVGVRSEWPQEVQVFFRGGMVEHNGVKDLAKWIMGGYLGDGGKFTYGEDIQDYRGARGSVCKMFTGSGPMGTLEIIIPLVYAFPKDGNQDPARAWMDAVGISKAIFFNDIVSNLKGGIPVIGPGDRPLCGEEIERRAAWSLMPVASVHAGPGAALGDWMWVVGCDDLSTTEGGRRLRELSGLQFSAFGEVYELTLVKRGAMGAVRLEDTAHALTVEDATSFWAAANPEKYWAAPKPKAKPKPRA